MAAIARGEISIQTKRFGACECPGAIHDSIPVPGDEEKRTGDWFQYKSRIFYGDIRKVNAADPDERQGFLFLRALTAWNLVDAAGEPLPLSFEGLDQLSMMQAGVLTNTLDSPDYLLAGIALPNPTPGTGESPAPEQTTSN